MKITNMNKGKFLCVILHIVTLQILILSGLNMFPEVPEIKLEWSIVGVYVITAILCGICNGIEKTYKEKQNG